MNAIQTSLAVLMAGSSLASELPFIAPIAGLLLQALTMRDVCDSNISSDYVPTSASSGVTFFLLTVRIMDYHWDHHLYFVIHSHHAQTMTHTPPSDDSILILLLVVLAACDSD
jgi:hypothetical protein